MVQRGENFSRGVLKVNRQSQFNDCRLKGLEVREARRNHLVDIE